MFKKNLNIIICISFLSNNLLLAGPDINLAPAHNPEAQDIIRDVVEVCHSIGRDDVDTQSLRDVLIKIAGIHGDPGRFSLLHIPKNTLAILYEKGQAGISNYIYCFRMEGGRSPFNAQAGKSHKIGRLIVERYDRTQEIGEKLKFLEGEDSGRGMACKAPGAKALDEETKDGSERVYVENQIFTNERIDGEIADGVVQLIQERMAEGQVFEAGRINLKVVQGIKRYGFARGEGKDKPEDLIYVYSKFDKESGKWELYVTEGFYRKLIENPLLFAEEIDHEWHENVIAPNMGVQEGLRHRFAASRAVLFRSRPDFLSAFHEFILGEILSHSPYGYRFLRGILTEKREYPESLRTDLAYEYLFRKKVMDNISGLIKEQIVSVFEFIRANFANKGLVGQLEKFILRYAPEYLDGRMDLNNLTRRLKKYYSRIIGGGGVNVEMLELALEKKEGDCYGRALFLMIWKGSLKELVRRNSENVRAELSRKGVRCEYLTNIYAGQSMTAILSNIEGNRQINKGLRQRISDELEYMTGYDLGTLGKNETLASIFADEIVSVIRSLLPGGLVEGLISAKPDIGEDINVAVSSRNIYSLKAGDRAGDCTKVGQFNHWAAGTWESVFENIGIEISYKGEFFSRAVLLVGVDESDEPVLWVHAIEFSPLAREKKGVFAGLPNEKMIGMFSRPLIVYAGRAGIRKVLLTGISNSLGIQELLKRSYGESVRRTFQLVEGMNSGIQILLPGSEWDGEASINMYIQGWSGPTNFARKGGDIVQQKEYVDMGGYRFKKGIIDQVATGIAGSLRSLFEEYGESTGNKIIEIDESINRFGVLHGSIDDVKTSIGELNKIVEDFGIEDENIRNRLQAIQGCINSYNPDRGMTEEEETSFNKFRARVIDVMGSIRYYRPPKGRIYGGIGAGPLGLRDKKIRIDPAVIAKLAFEHVIKEGVVDGRLAEVIKCLFRKFGGVSWKDEWGGHEVSILNSEGICFELLHELINDKIRTEGVSLPLADLPQVLDNILWDIKRLLSRCECFDMNSEEIVRHALRVHEGLREELLGHLNDFGLTDAEKGILLDNLAFILDYYKEQSEKAFSKKASFKSAVDVYEVKTRALVPVTDTPAHMQAVGITFGAGYRGFIEKTEVKLRDEEIGEEVGQGLRESGGLDGFRDMVKNGIVPDGLERIETISVQKIAGWTRKEGRDINIVLPDGSIRRIKIMGSDIDYMESKGVPENKFLELLKGGLETDHIVNGTGFSSIGDGTVISLLDTSRYVGANCKKDGFIGINKVVFELPPQTRDIMLQLAFVHEVRHEINQEETAGFEDIQLRKDTGLFVRIIGQGFLDVLNNLILFNSLSISPGFISSVYNFAVDNDLAGTAKIDMIDLSCDISKPVLLTGRNNKRVIIPSYVLRILKEMADLSRRLEIELPAIVYVKNGVATKVFYPGTESEIAIVKIDRDIKGQRGNPAFYFVGSHLIGAVKNFVERKRRGEECRINIRAEAGFAIEAYNAGELNVEDLYFKIFSKSRGGFYTVSFDDLVKYVDCGNEEFFNDILNVKYFGTKWWSEEIHYLLRRVPKEYLKREGGGELLRIHRHPNGYPSPPSAFSNKTGDIYSGGFMKGALNGLILDDKGRDILFLFFEPDSERETDYKRMFRKYWEDGQSVLKDLERIAMKPCVMSGREVTTRKHLREVEEAYTAYADKKDETIDIASEIIIPEEYLKGEGFDFIDMIRANNRSRDVKIIPLQSAKEMAKELENAGERIVLLRTEDLDRETQKHVKCRVLGFKDYNFLHLASAIGLARAILRDDKEFIERFYILLMHRQLTLEEGIRINVPQGVILLELPPIDENLVEGINSLRDEYARLMMSA